MSVSFQLEVRRIYVKLMVSPPRPKRCFFNLARLIEGNGAANHFVTGATRDAHEMFPPVM
ncbi:hypothetical protein DQ393_04175 [Rhizobium tropici]|uniref:Uncharacterized protein n=1 Tax=Rhizobium tropici TaxID=398 RepID=A0A329YKJ9_RHITR|nr:hypothetical protein DQ393_04175 [Rhizobium tropici]